MQPQAPVMYVQPQAPVMYVQPQAPVMYFQPQAPMENVQTQCPVYLIPDDYKLLHPLGKGGFSEVFAAQHSLGGPIVAIKLAVSKTTDAGRLKTQSDYLMKEIRIHQKLCHPNIVAFHRVFWRPTGFPGIVMEYVDGTTLAEHLIKKERALREEEARPIFLQLLHAVDYLHRNGVSNRDIKLDNVMITSEGVVKLIDFGLSKESGVDTPPNSIVGTKLYMAPEVMKNIPVPGQPRVYCGFMADIWSCGVLLYTLVAGHNPFVRPEDPANNHLLAIERSKQAPAGLPRHQCVPERCWDLLERILVADPEKRLSMQGIQEHPWIREAPPAEPPGPAPLPQGGPQSLESIEQVFRERLSKLAEDSDAADEDMVSCAGVADEEALGTGP